MVFYAHFSAFILVACIYLALTFAIIIAFRKIELRMLTHLRPRITKG